MATFRNSPRKTAESTGKLPPTPTLQTAAKEHSAIELGEPPAAMAKTPVMKSVMLKHHFLPQTSQATPQNAAPTRRPMFCPSLRNGPWKPNSFTTGSRIRPVTIYIS